ncbi:MAG: hypothetical protein ACE5DN_04760, partial [Flavobacteriales bacterium]
NVVVQETPEGEIQIAAVDPVVSMQAIENPALGELAEKIQAKLKKVIVVLMRASEQDKNIKYLISGTSESGAVCRML